MKHLFINPKPEEVGRAKELIASSGEEATWTVTVCKRLAPSVYFVSDANYFDPLDHDGRERALYAMMAYREALRDPE